METTPKCILWGSGSQLNMRVDPPLMSARNAKKPNITGFNSNLSHNGNSLTELNIFNSSISPSHPRVQLVSVISFI